jgi:hypothetical protein
MARLEELTRGASVKGLLFIPCQLKDPLARRRSNGSPREEESSLASGTRCASQYPQQGVTRDFSSAQGSTVLC